MTEPHAFADLLAPALERAASHPGSVEAALAAIDAAQPGPGRFHPCSECSRMRDRDPDVTISEAESWVHNGQRFWGALCAQCADLAWSKRWKKLHEAARSKGSVDEMRALDAAREKRLEAGRRVYV